MRHPLAVTALLALLASGCATPIPPSGGPQDTTPPRLESAEPAAGAVNVRADRLVLTFSENIDEASATRAFGIVPGWETTPEVRVRGRRVEVEFPDALRETTTYVVTFDTNLRDLHSVELRQPITLAFATGPELDRGRIEGRVLGPRAGAPVSGIDVFAYALPDSVVADSTATDPAALPDPRTDAPDYRTQSGEGGTFALDYLRTAPFFVVAVADADRNRRADPGEAFAVPYDPIARAVVPDSAGVSAPSLRLFRTRLDTIPPLPLRVRTRSDARFAVRFDEPVVLRDRTPDAWALVDSSSGRAATIREVYADDDPQQVVLRTEPLAPVPHRLWLTQPTAIADSSGNPARPDTLVFTPPEDADTLGVRFLGFLPSPSDDRTTLSPLDTAAVRFNAPPDSAALARIAVADTLGAPLPISFTTRDGVRYRVVPDATVPFRVEVPRPDSTYARLFVPASPDELGDLLGVIVSPDSGQVVVEAVAGPARYVAQADATGAFTLTGLPEAEYHIRVFVDRDGDGRWDGGRLAPYRPPEPLRFLDAPQRVRPRWETVLDTVRLEGSTR